MSHRSRWTLPRFSKRRSNRRLRHPRRGLAYLSTHGWDDAGRYGRTSTHDPRLLASQQSPCDEQVSSSNAGEQTLGAGQAGECHLAGRYAVGKQINSRSVVGAKGHVLGFVRGNARRAECFEAYWTQTDPDFFWVCCKCLKIWRGRRDLRQSRV
jgi:hypothetical protein